MTPDPLHVPRDPASGAGRGRPPGEARRLERNLIDKKPKRKTKTVNTFYQGTVKQHLQKLFGEKVYYLSMSQKKLSSGAAKKGHLLMVDFYDALIDRAQKHIAENS